MSKNIIINAKLFIEATVDDEADIEKYDGLYDFSCRVIDGLDITVKDATGKVTIKRVDFNNFEAEIWDGEIQVTDIEKVGKPKAFEVIDEYGYKGEQG